MRVEFVIFHDYYLAAQGLSEFLNRSLLIKMLSAAASGGVMVESPANFVPGGMIETGTRGAGDGTGLPAGMRVAISSSTRFVQMTAIA